MSTIEKAIAQMEAWAQDDSHGYDQANRWGPDYDCSSAVIQAWQNAGVPVKAKGATYTGNMYSVFKSCGFEDVTASVDLNSGTGLERGDVLLNHVHHTAMYCGNGKLVQASINELGKITGGQTGDQTGKEFYIWAYHNYPWNAVLRYKGYGTITTDSSKWDDNQMEYWPPRELEYKSNTQIMKGPDVKLAQVLLLCRDYDLGVDKDDGEYGPKTRLAIVAFQAENGLIGDGVCGSQTWTKLLDRKV